MKYIMFKSVEGTRIPLIFPNQLVHADVAQVMMRYPMEPLRPETAGSIVMAAVYTSDRSETLKLESAEEDAALINCIDYGTQGLPIERVDALIRARTAQMLLESIK